MIRYFLTFYLKWCRLYLPINNEVEVCFTLQLSCCHSSWTCCRCPKCPSLTYFFFNHFVSESEDQVVNLSLIYSNRAACCLKMGNCQASIEDCTTSLDLVPHAVKPLLRRAAAYETLERFESVCLFFFFLCVWSCIKNSIAFTTKIIPLSVGA